MDQKQLLDIFFAEADELIQTIEQDLVSLDASPDDPFLVDKLFRAVHTIKSSAGMVGFTKISEYAHLFENLLERLRNKTIVPTREIISFLLMCGDFLKVMLANVAEGQNECDPNEFEDMTHSLNRYLDPAAQNATQTAIRKTETSGARGKRSSYKISMTFQKNLFITGHDPLSLLLELQELGELTRIEPNLSKLPDIHKILPHDLYISWEILFRTDHPMGDVHNVFVFVQEDNDIHIEDISGRLHADIDRGEQDFKEMVRTEKNAGGMLVQQEKIYEQEAGGTVLLQKKSEALPRRKPMVRVKTERLDRLVNLMEEMTIGLDTLFLLLEKSAIRNGKIRDELEHLINVGREAQEQVMMTRMFPLEGTFGRFQRMIRDLAVSQDKPIRVILSGTETELDRDIVEQLGDPLKHIIRNCLDHGIENREERKKKEKTEEGTISLKAYQKEGRIYIEISDDGRGIDEQRILEKAIRRNQLPTGSVPSKRELYQFLFYPGFSTSDEINELSGRGVGLDVVQTNVSELGGNINIVSEKNRGTTFIIDLPMTLAIMRAIKIRVGEEMFLVPFSVIAGLIRPGQGDIKTIEGREELISFQSEYITLIRLSEVFKVESSNKDESDGIVVIVESEKRRFGVFADDILDEQQVVIKNLETNFQKVAGIAGGTILGDGQVALIIDIYALEEMLFTGGDKNSPSQDLSQETHKDLAILEG